MSDSATKSFTARLRFATVKTDDVARTVRFYEEILGLPRTRTAEDFVQLDAGDAELCIDLDDGRPHQPRLILAPVVLDRPGVTADEDNPGSLPRAGAQRP